MQKVNTKKKIILAIIGLLILVIIALLIGRFTFSYLGADIGEDVKNEGEITASGDTIIFSKGNNLSLSATTDNFNATSGNLTDTTNPSVRLIASNKTNEASATYYAGIRISKNTFTYSSGTTAELILTVRDETGALVTTSSDDLDYVTVNGISGFDITGKTGAFNISSKHPINTNSSTSGTTHTWTFTLTFVNLETDQSINENATLDMDVVLQKDEIMPPTLAELCSGITFAECIKEVAYTADGENGLYYHDGVGTYTNAVQEAGDNSYRYSGANPNNYVCFGSNAETCPDEYLYRIIGVFDNQVKLIKAISYGKYAWDSGSSNIWNETTKPDIYTTLNITYYETLSDEWQGLIDQTHIWQVGEISNIDVAKTIYDYEVGANQDGYEEIMAIGLMYVSDYGYAANPSKWATMLSTRYYGTDNWLYLDLYEWFISSAPDVNGTSIYVFYVLSGTVGGAVGSNSVNNIIAVRPTFYLESNVILEGGSGSISNPYRLVV